MMYYIQTFINPSYQVSSYFFSRKDTEEYLSNLALNIWKNSEEISLEDFLNFVETANISQMFDSVKFNKKIYIKFHLGVVAVCNDTVYDILLTIYKFVYIKCKMV